MADLAQSTAGSGRASSTQWRVPGECVPEGILAAAGVQPELPDDSRRPGTARLFCLPGDDPGDVPDVAAGVHAVRVTRGHPAESHLDLDGGRVPAERFAI